MKLKKLLSALFALLGACVAAVTIQISMNAMDSKPVLLTPPDVARSKVVMLMNSICDGNYAEASQSIYGTPDLGVDREASDEVGILIWDAFESSISYELVGECYTTEQGLAQKVSITCLGVTSITDHLRDRSQALLEQRVAEAADVSEIYDENNEYREDFVMNVLYDATVAVLEENAKKQTCEVTVNLSYQDGNWWVVADEALLDAISGGILY